MYLQVGAGQGTVSREGLSSSKGRLTNGITGAEDTGRPRRAVSASLKASFFAAQQVELASRAV